MLFFTATETSDVVYQLRMSCELGDPTGSPQVCTRTSNPETSFLSRVWKSVVLLFSFFTLEPRKVCFNVCTCML